MGVGKHKKLGKSKKTSIKLPDRYRRNERIELTGKAARVFVMVLQKPSGGKVLKRRLKAHDPKGRIVKLESYTGPAMKKSFPPVYRDFWPPQDEFIRTSFVTDVLQRILNRTLTLSEWLRLKSAVDSFSNFRFPTRWSGFKLEPGYDIGGHTEMQHPTSPNTGIWIPSKSSFSKAHTELDEARVRAVIDAINGFIQKDVDGVLTLKPETNLEEVVRAGLVAAGTFTMRFFTAPALAGNVEATATTNVKTAQTKAREFMKDQLESVGARRYVPPPGVVIPKLNLPEREFRSDLLQPGEISPRRGSVVSQFEAETLWDAA